MNATYCIESLVRFPDVLRAVINGVDNGTLGKRGGEDGKAWSIVEILCHLADEETEDFRVRLELTLTHPAATWPGIDPEGVAKSRDYQKQDPHEALDRFIAARVVNLRWLKSLDAPDWSIEHAHPRIGNISAGDLLASWAAHDLLHLRQITKRLFERVSESAQPYSTGYAGQWAI